MSWGSRFGSRKKGSGESKFKSKKVILDGITFDSKLEAEYYLLLKNMKRAGEIKNFEMQVVFVLQEGFYNQNLKKKAFPIKYIADFIIEYPDGHKECHETKGFETPDYKIKKKMLLYKNPDLIFKTITSKGVM